MQIETFESSPVGRLVPISGYDHRRGDEFHHVAFVPDPLPPTVDLATSTWQAVGEAMMALGELNRAINHIPNPRLLQRPSIRQEAHSTSALEGTYAPFTDVLEAEVTPHGPMTPELREIINYIRVSEHAFEWVRERPITTHALCSLQQILVLGTSGERRDTGRLREVQVIIGPADAPVTQARFVPPPEGDLLEEGVREWERWVNSDHGLPIVVEAALAHYQFETLHPFSDGNGRLGRLIVLLQFLRAGALREPLLAISPWLELRRREYQDHLLRVSQTGDFDPWVAFFAEGIRASAEDTCTQIDGLLAIYADHREICRANKVRGVAAQLAEDLIGDPLIRVPWVKGRYNVSYPAANSAVKRLVSLGILKEMTGRNYDRVFASPRILQIAGRL